MLGDYYLTSRAPRTSVPDNPLKTDGSENGRVRTSKSLPSLKAMEKMAILIRINFLSYLEIDQRLAEILAAFIQDCS